jgi:hypothetical protein
VNFLAASSSSKVLYLRIEASSTSWASTATDAALMFVDVEQVQARAELALLSERKSARIGTVFS